MIIGTLELPIAVPREDRVLPPGITAGAAAEYSDASENVGNMHLVRAFWLARDRAFAAEQQPDQGGGVRSPAHSERSELLHFVPELGAGIKALQESKPEPFLVVRPRLQARSPRPPRRPRRIAFLFNDIQLSKIPFTKCLK